MINSANSCKYISTYMVSNKFLGSRSTNIITGDESWFLYLNQPKARWVLAGDDPGEIVISTNYQKK